jgi:hypothetical protein
MVMITSLGHSFTSFGDMHMCLLVIFIRSLIHILDGVAILHETIHELHSKKLNALILKIDFEKAYDKVKWSFL